MNYELAKELKEAGFPTPQTIDTLKVEKFRPTLEELIEACGDGIIGLTRGAVTEDWLATNNTYTVSGPTPTEAVARLWLALNKKDATK